MKELSEVDFKSTVENGFTLVDFWAEWCGPCKMIAPILEELDSEFDNVEFYKVDADANTTLAAELGINSIPTVLFYKDGELVSTQNGAKPKALMRKFIENAIQ
jgi:thioredoxin 1